MFLNRLLLITGYRLEKVNTLSDTELLERHEAFQNILLAHKRYKQFKTVLASLKDIEAA